MKLRFGFVSNSSSSSFVAVFKRIPKTVQDVFDMMFNGKNEMINIYDMDGLSTFDIAQTVMNNLKNKKGKFIFVQEYSDNNGSNGCIMEHGDIFRNVEHIQVSNH